jgi:hypothetical protein
MQEGKKNKNPETPAFSTNKASQSRR